MLAVAGVFPPGGSACVPSWHGRPRRPGQWQTGLNRQEVWVGDQGSAYVAAGDCCASGPGRLGPGPLVAPGAERRHRPRCEQGGKAPPLIADDALHSERPSVRRAGQVLAVGLVAWALPLIAVLLLTGRDSVFTEQGLFFSGTALVTFGGAYAVLAYVAQRAVEDFGWLAPNEMVRGLALAETTPGPLIMVVQFVAFLGAYRDPGGIDPWLAALIGALLTTWVTFVPCFLLIFLGAPYVERLRGNRPLSATLTGITSAVVGVIANLAVYFALHTLFRETSIAATGPLRVELPDLGTVRPVAVVTAVVAAILLFKVKWSVLPTLGACAALGLVLGLAGLPVS